MVTDLFNPASVSALLSGVVSAIAAACASLLGRVPDWDDVRPLTWVALTASLAAGCNFTATLDVPLEVYLWTGRLQVLMIALHVRAWLVYLPRWARQPLGAALRRSLWVLVAAGLLALWPGAMYGDTVVARPVAWLGIVYRDPVVTPTATLIEAVIAAYGFWGLGLAARLARQGAPFPLAHLACIGSILVMALHDAVVVAGLPLPTPYLLDFAFYGPITVLGLVTIRRVGQSATDLRHLNAGLAGLVAERSAELERSQAALTRAERLAALGQFAAGVAHEVNNPAMVVAANLELLADELRDDPRDGVWTSLRDAQAGVGRISALVQHLLVAGRTASRPEAPLAPVPVGPAVEAALGAARVRAGTHVTLDVSLPHGLAVLAHHDSLVQVLSNLLLSAVQAFPAGQQGTVSVRGQQAGDLVRLLIDDDGAGMSEEALQHVFEPFYEVKPSGMGTGLGLAVSLGLVKGMQGRLAYESTLGRGTRAVLELQRAAAPAPVSEPGRPIATPPPAAARATRARMLVVDDDQQVLASMARLLGRAHEVKTAAGVWAGLDLLCAGEVDLVLCDVMMPGGGGERFWAELPLRAPWAMERVAFMTGGAATQEARAFLARQPRPVLAKPFDLTQVDEVLASLRGRPAGAPTPPTTALPIGGGPTPGRSLGRVRRS